ncbi:hypothetical protein JXO59_13020 [candidate division KSB1 bacterium]|nr:hypothetical protein [candidate division KSB1 bacterium]
MNRWIRILLYAAALSALIWYGHAYNPAITLPMCLAQPQRYDGSVIEIGTEVTVREILPDGFTIHQMGRVIPVQGPTVGLREGDFVVLSAVFHAPDRLQLKDIYVARGRRRKIVVSIFPVIVVLYVLIRTYRFDVRRFIIVER